MKRKFRKSILVTILTISLFSSLLPVLACEQVSESDNNIVQITDPDEIKAAAEMFGLDEEEAEGVTFYSQNIEVLNPGITQMPTFLCGRSTEEQTAYSTDIRLLQQFLLWVIAVLTYTLDFAAIKM